MGILRTAVYVLVALALLLSFLVMGPEGPQEDE